ncbi:MAG: PP2C family protein-serine/threonine phosphatase, partial [Rickettsiales bacterium]
MQSSDPAIQTRLLASPILIVEDNEISSIFLQKTLQQCGFTKLTMVSSAEEALTTLETLRPELVILDLMLPGMDGFECCSKIRAQSRFRDLPVLVQTAITEPELRVKAFQHGATDFISKPVYPQELVARVMVHLEKRHVTKILTQYRDRTARELESARLLQQSILPGRREIENIHEFCGLDVAAHYQPSSEIGGDFWGMKRLFPHQAAFWLVDFAGHGVASALNAFRLDAYLKEHSLIASRPGDYMALLNEKLLQLLQRGQFATMFYGIVDTQSDRLYYACACTPHPVIVRAETGHAQILNGCGNPMGIGIHAYATQETTFMPGDSLFFYSDALIETPNAAGVF